MIYVIGSMRSPRAPQVAKELRHAGYEVFDDWFAPGPDADDCWQAYEKARGHTYAEALAGPHAKTVFNFDLQHLRRATAVVLVLPAGKSAHLELGWSLGQGKPGFILLDGEPERYDVMYQFATAICEDIHRLILELVQRGIQ